MVVALVLVGWGGTLVGRFKMYLSYFYFYPCFSLFYCIFFICLYG